MIIGDIICDCHAADYIAADGSEMLLCDGRILLPGTYPVLQTLIGAAFGAPGQIPNLGAGGGNTGYFPIGASAAGGYALGAKAGVELHLHSAAGFSLVHSWVGPAVTQPGGAGINAAAGVTDAPIPGHTHGLAASPNPNHGAQPNTDNANALPPLLAVNFFIKAA